MMVIKLGCPRCGEVDLAADEIGLELASDQTTYRFDCPGCRQPVVKRADVRTLRLFRAHGIRAQAKRSSAPASAGPSLTPDDLIDFHFQLESDEAIAHLMELWSASVLDEERSSGTGPS
jgi:predicted RNA-binding Zn-ribbon protein involved in translation (DUF1610 family)